MSTALASWTLMLAVTFGAAGCGPSLPPRFVSERDRAIELYARGDYRGAARHWHAAAEHAPDARERDEAMFREAASLERAGDRTRAEALYLTLERGHGERAARAAYARADSVLARGEASGFELLGRAVLRFPNAGPARDSVRRVVEHARERGGPDAERRELERFAEKLAGSELEETLSYRRARWLEDNGDLSGARAAYLASAARFPYPRGVYWDDCLIGAARLDERAGRYREAIAHLETVTRHREESRLSGSYERSSFAEARFHIAEILRDKLGEPLRARAEFRRVFSEHPTSRLGDDALFEEALLALAAKDGPAACATARLLVQTRADSRYAACARSLCPELEAKGDCRAYIQARIRRAKGSEADAATTPRDDYSSSSE